MIKQKHLNEPENWKLYNLLPLQDSDILSLGVSSHRSWWKDNGPGCETDSLPAPGWQKQQNPELTTVLSCWLEYQYIEILHCIVQLLMSVSLCHTSCITLSDIKQVNKLKRQYMYHLMFMCVPWFLLNQHKYVLRFNLLFVGWRFPSSTSFSKIKNIMCLLL